LQQASPSIFVLLRTGSQSQNLFVSYQIDASCG
jgi:hypothetical protein